MLGMILEHGLGLGATVSKMADHDVLVNHHNATGEARVMTDVLLVVSQAVGTAHERYREMTKLFPCITGEEDGTDAIAHGADRIRELLCTEALCKGVNVAKGRLALAPHVSSDLGLADDLTIVVETVAELDISQTGRAEILEETELLEEPKVTVAAHVDERRDESRPIKTIRVETLVGIEHLLEESLGQEHVLVKLVDPLRLGVKFDGNVLNQGEVVDRGGKVGPIVSLGNPLEDVVLEAARHDADVNVLRNIGSETPEHVIPQRWLVAGEDDAELVAPLAAIDKVVP